MEKLKQNCDLTISAATLWHETRFEFSKIEVKLRFNNFGRNHFAQNKARVSQSEVELLFNNFRGNFFARNEVRVSKMEGFFAGLAAATLSHEVKVECHKLRKKLRLTTARATLSRETKLECQN